MTRYMVFYTIQYTYKKWCSQCYTSYSPNVLPVLMEELDKRHVVDKTYYIQIGGLENSLPGLRFGFGERRGRRKISRFGFGTQNFILIFLYIYVQHFGSGGMAQI